MKFKFLLTALLAAGLAAHAQAPAEVNPENLIPQEMLKDISPEALEQGRALGQSVVQDVLEAYRTKATEEDYKFADDTRRRVDTIANEAMEADRAAVLEFLGIDPAADSGLYIFVSWSMPLEVLRSYAIEAMWSGATLVFRGVPMGEDAGGFFSEKLRLLVHGKGAAANISVDPRLFDAYKVTAVPSIVFTTVRQDMQCTGVNPTPVALPGGGTANYDKCPELEDSLYWKVSGAVTTSYALQTFIGDGAKLAQPYMSALSRGFATGDAPAKAQVKFTGKWETVPSPSEQMAARQAAQTMLPESSPAPAQPATSSN